MSADDPPYCYTAYGLVICSDIPIPNLLAVPYTGATQSDLTIVSGKVAAIADDDALGLNWSGSPARLTFEWPDCVRGRAEAGYRLVYERLGDADERQIVSAILGTGLAAILMQRKVLPIHAASVKTSRGALLIMGRSGAGKSTLLTGLLELGLSMMADDVTGLRIGPNGIPTALPAFPATRLWRDSAVRAGHDPVDLPPVKTGIEKFYVKVGRFHNQPEPIAALCWLNPTNRTEPLIEPIKWAVRSPTLHRFVYRKLFLRSLGLQSFVFECAVKTANAIPMMRLDRPAKEIEPRALATYLLHEAGL